MEKEQRSLQLAMGFDVAFPRQVASDKNGGLMLPLPLPNSQCLELDLSSLWLSSLWLAPGELPAEAVPAGERSPSLRPVPSSFSSRCTVRGRHPCTHMHAMSQVM